MRRLLLIACCVSLMAAAADAMRAIDAPTALTGVYRAEFYRGMTRIDVRTYDALVDAGGCDPRRSNVTRIPARRVEQFACVPLGERPSPTP